MQVFAGIRGQIFDSELCDQQSFGIRFIKFPDWALSKGRVTDELMEGLGIIRHQHFCRLGTLDFCEQRVATRDLAENESTTADIEGGKAVGCLRPVRMGGADCHQAVVFALI